VQPVLAGQHGSPDVGYQPSMDGTIPAIHPWRQIMNFSIECEEEVDGRWLAEVPQLPGVLCYGQSAEEATAKAEVLALRTMAERLEHGESRAVDISISIPLAA
jgi:predicted RNase H-like HicB family nuclease